MNTFLASLGIMGIGMAGIFLVAVVLMGVMKILTSLFPGDNPQ